MNVPKDDDCGSGISLYFERKLSSPTVLFLLSFCFCFVCLFIFVLQGPLCLLEAGHEYFDIVQLKSTPSGTS